MTAPAAGQISAHVVDARFFRVLSDPTRLAIAANLLADGPLTVGELVARIGGPQSRVSNHLACLRWCRFVSHERQGRQVRYSIADPRLGRLLDLTHELVADKAEHLASCERVGPSWA
jgi:DNA-binding transcriptional ArsR family regulator